MSEQPAPRPVKVGVVKPTITSKSLNDLAALLPPTIELLPEYIGFSYKSEDEFARAIPAYAEHIATLAARGADLIHPEGAPPFMLQGLAEERRLIAEWEQRHGVPVFTTGTTQLAAMRALGVHRIAGFSPFDGPLAAAFSRYFSDAAIDVIAMGRPQTAGGDLYSIPADAVKDALIQAFAALPARPDALYLLGSGWRAFDVIEDIEAAIGVPVLHPVAVRCWYILQRTRRPRTYDRHGRLLREMPSLPI